MFKLIGPNGELNITSKNSTIKYRQKRDNFSEVEIEFFDNSSEKIIELIGTSDTKYRPLYKGYPLVLIIKEDKDINYIVTTLCIQNFEIIHKSNDFLQIRLLCFAKDIKIVPKLKAELLY